ncbi:hypothetical protein [uncultured Methanolobus sp.]|uniref:hypothetical protein n=1 Tax=uncultured Methanolobus sp. TaxID=218300 RepID=UPI0029C8F033|nr:hypothetical protein [uncultured Methanolobus sp.]
MGIQDRDYYNPKSYSTSPRNEKNITAKSKRKNIRLSYKQKILLFFMLFLISLSVKYEYITIIQFALGILFLYNLYKYANWKHYNKVQRYKRMFKKYFSTISLILGVLLILNYTSYLGYHDANTDSMVNFMENQLSFLNFSANPITSINTDSRMYIGESGISHKDMKISMDYYSLDNKVEYTSDSWGLSNKGVLSSPEGAAFLMIHLTAENIGDTISDKNTIIVNPDTVAKWEYGNEVKGENVDVWGVSVKATESYPTNPDCPYLIYNGNKIGIEETSALAINDCVTEKFYYNSYTMDKYSPVFDDFGARYPNVVKQGWMMFIVPANIDLSQTTLNIQNLEWKFEYEENNQNQKVRVPIE